jgi:hypothetical protein
LVATQAAQVIDPIPAHQELGELMFAARHSKQVIPILMRRVPLSSPFSN